MSRPHDPRDPRDPASEAAAAREVESEIEELGDPEAAPPLPSATLVAQSTTPLVEDGRARRRSARTGNTREILRLSWPVMATQLVIAMAGLIDRAMVGRLGGDDGAAIPLAAVGYATQFFFFIQSTLFAVGLACVALMARAIGAGDPQRARLAMAASLQVSLVTTAVLAGAMLAGGRSMLGWLGADPVVADAALPYLNLVISSSILLAAAMIFDSALRANRDMRTPLWISLAVTVVKLVGNWILIFGELGAPRLELAGAGLATLLSQLVGLVLFGWVVLSERADSPVAFGLGSLRASASLRREVVRISMPGIAERIVMNLAMLSYFWVLSRYYGTLAVAAYTVGVALVSFSWIPGTAYAQACATLVGQALGARAPDTATSVGWRSAALALGTATILGLLFGGLRVPLAELFTNDAAVVRELGPFMLTLAFAQPFLQLHFTLGGAHRGAGDTWTPLVAATVGNWLFRVPLACFFAIYLEWSVLWVWYALLVDHLARAIHLTWSFRRGRWRTRLERAPTG